MKSLVTPGPGQRPGQKPTVDLGHVSTLCRLVSFSGPRIWLLYQAGTLCPSNAVCVRGTGTLKEMWMNSWEIKGHCPWAVLSTPPPHLELPTLYCDHLLAAFLSTLYSKRRWEMSHSLLYSQCLAQWRATLGINK